LKTQDIVTIKPFDSPILRAGPVNLGVHLRNSADKIGSAMVIRDIAIRAGATGATVVLFKEGKPRITSVHPEFFLEHPNLARNICEVFDFENNDVVVMVSAEDKWKGLEASLTIASFLSHVQ
jgi:hypothetical protein